MNPLLRHSIGKALEPVFGTLPVFFSDDYRVVKWLNDHNIPAKALDINENDIPSVESAVVIPTNRQTGSYFQLHKLFENSRVLIIPVAAFDPSLDATLYTLTLLGQSDFVLATKKNKDWVELLETDVKTMVFQKRDSLLEVALRERIDLMLPKLEPELLSGEWEAIGAFFEVAMIPDNEDFFHPGYVINGEVFVQGVAVAHHRIMPESLTHLPRQSWALLKRIYTEGGFPLAISIANSQVKSIRTAHNVYIHETLREFTNPAFELMIVEMAVSNNPSLKDVAIDWGINSVLNEGLEGIHFAVGDGVTGAHIDFLCPGMELVKTL